MLRRITAWSGKADILPETKWAEQRRNLLEKTRQLQPLANKDWLLEMLV